MRMGLLHLDLAAGPVEENHKKLEAGIKRAAECGADWIITPEAAVEGYFYRMLHNDASLPVWTPLRLRDFQMWAELLQVDVFLAGGERDPWDGKDYAALYWIGKHGELARLHRKMYSHQTGMEAWMSLGRLAGVEEIGGVRTGVLICSDAYYKHPADMMRLKGAEVVLVPAGWPPGACCPDPPKVWERCSERTGAAVVVCNQTGKHPEMNMTEGKSAVVEDGKVRFSYSGRPAVLLFDYDVKEKRVLSSQFIVKEAE